MTKTQRKVYELVRACLEKANACPSYREIAAALGLRSVSGVDRLVKDLVKQNYLTAEAGKKRGLQVVYHRCPHCRMEIRR